MIETLKFHVLQLLPTGWRRRRLTAYFEKEIAGGGERELRILNHLVRPGDHCVDIGCNMGVYSYRLSQLGAKVSAFEPNPTMAGLVSGLDLPGVEMNQVAVSDQDGMAVLHIPVVDTGHALASLRSEKRDDVRMRDLTVPTRRLDSIDLPEIKFIKIDVEGFEEQVLNGANETITRYRPALLIEIEERHNEGGLRRIEKRLRDVGYTGWYIGNAGWSPLDAFDLDRHQRAVAPNGPDRYINNFLFLAEDRQLPELH